MSATLKAAKQGGPATTLKVRRDVHTRLRRAADERRVQVASLTEFLLTSGLERIDREGLPLPVSA